MPLKVKKRYQPKNALAEQASERERNAKVNRKNIDKNKKWNHSKKQQETLSLFYPPRMYKNEKKIPKLSKIRILNINNPFIKYRIEIALLERERNFIVRRVLGFLC
ncbi:hypothetical protein NPIL_182721 [Nephila pilipes]|uniref:Uncharacterized protein n=1 Tax=Nephila pilipes TaxID=299642 RepID=A0A8X6NKC5_NEPPI|nr:hypothetical protein NPIL_182721 [Nephila pilipes]